MKINALLVISRVLMMSSDYTATLYLACALLLSKQWMIMWLLVKNLDVRRKNLTLENLYYVSLLKFTRSLQCKRKSLEKALINGLRKRLQKLRMLKTDRAIKNSIHKRRCCYKEHGKTHAKTEPRAEHAAIHVETVPEPHG